MTTRALIALAPGEVGAATADPRLGFEPNHIAAMPSVHVAAAVLVFLAWRQALPRTAMATLATLAYPVAMSVAVVYLGEHFILDAVYGWLVALLGWRFAWRLAPGGRRDRIRPLHPGRPDQPDGHVPRPHM